MIIRSKGRGSEAIKIGQNVSQATKMLDETLLGSIEGLCTIFISLEQDSESLIPLILFFFTRIATMRFEVALFLHGLFSGHSQIGTTWEKNDS